MHLDYVSRVEDHEDMLGTIKKIVESVEQVTCPLPPLFNSDTATPVEAEKEDA